MFTFHNGRHGSPLVSSQRTSVDWNEVFGPILGHQDPGRCATDAIRDCGGGHQSRARDAAGDTQPTCGYRLVPYLCARVQTAVVRRGRHI
jgi:hypothetical protein